MINYNKIDEDPHFRNGNGILCPRSQLMYTNLVSIIAFNINNLHV